VPIQDNSLFNLKVLDEKFKIVLSNSSLVLTQSAKGHHAPSYTCRFLKALSIKLLLSCLNFFKKATTFSQRDKM
jgi:hypothetical protein